MATAAALDGKSLALDKPLPLQYWTFVTNAFTGELGHSFASNVPAVDLILERANFIVQSSAVADELVAMGVDEARMFSAPNGVDVALHRPPTAEERSAARGALGFDE